MGYKIYGFVFELLVCTVVLQLGLGLGRGFRVESLRVKICSCPGPSIATMCALSKRIEITSRCYTELRPLAEIII